MTPPTRRRTAGRRVGGGGEEEEERLFLGTPLEETREKRADGAEWMILMRQEVERGTETVCVCVWA